jgi:hypothetical protein
VNSTTNPTTSAAAPASSGSVAAPPPFRLLDDLDARQDDLLAQLDDLNRRVEDLLKTCLADREGEMAASGEEASPATEPTSQADESPEPAETAD